MATNTTEMVAERPLAEEIFAVKNGKENGAASPHGAEPGPSLALAPLVDKIAWGIARGLVEAMKDLEDHIAGETRKVGDSVGRRMDAFQVSLQQLADASAASIESLKEADLRQDAGLASLRSETRTLAASVPEQIAAATTPLRQADVDRQAELASLRTQAAENSAAMSERIEALCRELNVQQEDVGAIKSALSAFSATVEGLAARLDRQADALRTMSAAYSQRETELESLVEGLARLRSYPAPPSVDRL